MTTTRHDRVPVILYACSATEYAWDTGLPIKILSRHSAMLPRGCYEALVAARAALETQPTWDSITVASNLECDALQALLDASPDWRTGDEAFLIYRFAGLYLRLTHKHDPQTQIEFEVCLADGTSI